MAAPPAIAVFGSSEPAPGEPAYELARKLGRLLASAGHPVVTGGYGGVMEAASRGAAESGGRVVGVTCEVFAAREPNRWIGEEVRTTDLHERTRRLIELAGGFVVLPGRAGTLAELALLWALHRAGCLGGRRVLLLGASWSGVLRALAEHDLLDPPELALARVVGTAEQAVAALGAAGPDRR